MNSAHQPILKDCNISHPEEIPTSRLEEMLAERRLQEERQAFRRTNVVMTSQKVAKLQAVGLTLCMLVKVGGVEVEAMVDTGSQSTIISRSLLHAIGAHCQSQDMPCLQLEVPTVRLFGKDGRGGGRELVITAQLQISIEADGESTVVPVFVQPESEQHCLLGMNVLLSLGLSIKRANGEPLIVKKVASEPVVSHVRLLRSSTVPCRKGKSFEGSGGRCVAYAEGCGPPLLFEPELVSMGLECEESLVSMDGDGCVLVPVEGSSV